MGHLGAERTMATQRWESCCLHRRGKNEIFLKNHLGPTMEKEGLKDKKIIVWDHNRDLIYQRAQTYFNDPKPPNTSGDLAFTGTKTGAAVHRCTIT